MNDEFDSITFKTKFWAWFDALPKIEKSKFWYYQADMAEIFFYNKIFVNDKIMVDDEK